MVIKPFNIIAVVVFLLSVFIVFQVGYKVRTMQKDLQEIERQIVFEQDSLHVLKAEWSYLNHPDRLRYLSSKYLDMKHMTLAQIDQIPESLEGKSFTISYDQQGDVNIQSVGETDDQIYFVTDIR